MTRAARITLKQARETLAARNPGMTLEVRRESGGFCLRERGAAVWSFVSNADLRPTTQPKGE